MNTNERVSRQGAKAQRETATGSRLASRHVYVSALLGFFRLCVFAPWRKIRVLWSQAIAIFLITWLLGAPSALAQTASTPNSTTAQTQPPPSRYLDRANGLTANDAVTYALSHNGELEAARKEIDAARAMVKQAGLRANPKLDVDGARQINGKDNTLGASAMLPLELGGRRAARIAVAEREVEVREREVANRERLLAAEVRAKFGEGLAQALKLSFTDELVEANQQSFSLIATRVTEGAAPPLEQNMALSNSIACVRYVRLPKENLKC